MSPLDVKICAGARRLEHEEVAVRDRLELAQVREMGHKVLLQDVKNDLDEDKLQDHTQAAVLFLVRRSAKLEADLLRDLRPLQAEAPDDRVLTAERRRPKEPVGGGKVHAVCDGEPAKPALRNDLAAP